MLHDVRRLDDGMKNIEAEFGIVRRSFDKVVDRFGCQARKLNNDIEQLQATASEIMCGIAHRGSEASEGSPQSLCLVKIPKSRTKSGPQRPMGHDSLVISESLEFLDAPQAPPEVRHLASHLIGGPCPATMPIGLCEELWTHTWRPRQISRRRATPRSMSKCFRLEQFASSSSAVVDAMSQAKIPTRLDDSWIEQKAEDATTTGTTTTTTSQVKMQEVAAPMTDKATTTEDFSAKVIKAASAEADAEVAKQEAAMQAMHIRAVDEATGPSNAPPPRERRLTVRPATRRRRRRTRSTSSSSRASSSSSRSTSKSASPSRAGGMSPPSGQFTGEYRPHERGRRERRQGEAPEEGKLYWLKFAQVVDGMDWDAENVMMAFGNSAKFASPSIVAFRSSLPRADLLQTAEDLIDRKSRVYYDHERWSFQVRTPERRPPQQAPSHRRPPPQGGRTPAPRSAKAAQLRPRSHQSGLAFWSGAVPIPTSAQGAQPPFSVWPAASREDPHKFLPEQRPANKRKASYVPPRPKARPHPWIRAPVGPMIELGPTAPSGTILTFSPAASIPSGVPLRGMAFLSQPSRHSGASSAGDGQASTAQADVGSQFHRRRICDSSWRKQ